MEHEIIKTKFFLSTQPGLSIGVQYRSFITFQSERSTNVPERSSCNIRYGTIWNDIELERSGTFVERSDWKAMNDSTCMNCHTCKKYFFVYFDNKGGPLPKKSLRSCLNYLFKLFFRLISHIAQDWVLRGKCPRLS
jgi:hypothetical protein